MEHLRNCALTRRYRRGISGFSVVFCTMCFRDSLGTRVVLTRYLLAVPYLILTFATPLSAEDEYALIMPWFGGRGLLAGKL